MPAHHTTVDAASISPLDRVTPSSLTAATRVPNRLSTPLAVSPASMTGRADAPMSEPTCGLWSTRMTLAPTSGKSALSRAGSSQAVSTPVSPAPTTTAVAAAGV